MTADGDVVVPIDAEAFGFWLKAAFGEPITSGTGPWTHEFRSGGWTLPSLSIETAMPEVPRFAMYSGCVLDQLSWQLQRSGLLTATAKLVAQGEAVGTTTAAGTPARAGAEALRPLQRQHHPQRLGARQRGLGRDHLRQQPRPHRDHPQRRPHRRRRSVDRRAHRPGRGALRRPGAGEPGDRRRPLRARVRLRAALGRELHLHRARRLPAAAADRDRRPAGRAGDLRLAGGPGHRLGRMCTATLVNDIEEY